MEDHYMDMSTDNPNGLFETVDTFDVSEAPSEGTFDLWDESTIDDMSGVSITTAEAQAAWEMDVALNVLGTTLNFPFDMPLIIREQIQNAAQDTSVPIRLNTQGCMTPGMPKPGTYKPEETLCPQVFPPTKSCWQQCADWDREREAIAKEYRAAAQRWLEQKGCPASVLKIKSRKA